MPHSSTCPPSPLVLFLTGPSGCGKTALSQAWVRHQLQRGNPWTLLDKDVVGGLHTPRLLKALGGIPADRDSPLYKREARDLDYGATLNLAASQLALGGSVVLPGPWTSELTSGRLFQPSTLGLPDVQSVVVWLTLPAQSRLERVRQRAHPQDAWKLQYWDRYILGAPSEPPRCVGGAPAILPADQGLDALVSALANLVDAARTAPRAYEQQVAMSLV